MRNEEQRIWREYMAIYTPSEEHPFLVGDRRFTSIRGLMKWLREQFPHRDWKATKFMAYLTPSHNIKYTYDKKGDE